MSGCGKEIPVINRSNTYAECNAILTPCTGNKVGEYCLFGYKWGVDQHFEASGIEAIGPKTAGGILTYSFQGSDQEVNTHRQTKILSESWEEILDCAQTEIRKAINDWQAVANISFKELPLNSDSDIQFYVAAILQSAVGYPNYTESACNILNGDVIFDANSKEKSCKGFYILALHEIGHVLGLGHVNSQNIMVSGAAKFSLDGLQSGDIEGVRQIYGEQ
jgi:hypothetical protein